MMEHTPHTSHSPVEDKTKWGEYNSMIYYVTFIYINSNYAIIKFIQLKQVWKAQTANILFVVCLIDSKNHKIENDVLYDNYKQSLFGRIRM